MHACTPVRAPSCGTNTWMEGVPDVKRGIEGSQHRPQLCVDVRVPVDASVSRRMAAEMSGHTSHIQLGRKVQHPLFLLGRRPSALLLLLLLPLLLLLLLHLQR